MLYPQRDKGVLAMRIYNSFAFVTVVLVTTQVAGQPCDPAFEDQLLPTSTTDNAYSSSALAIGGGNLLVGAYNDETLGFAAGCVYAYRQGDQGWSYVEQILPSGSAIGDDFGWATDCDAGLAVVGSPRDRLPLSSTRPGSVDLFLLNQTGPNWEYQTTLYPSTDSDDKVGYAVSLSGVTLAIGAPEDDDDGDVSGSVHVYREFLGDWQYYQHLTASDASEGSQFGCAIDSTESTIAVGAIGANGIGSVYVYQWGGASWIESQILTPFDGMPSDRFGQDIVVTDSNIFVGSDNDLASGNGSGCVYVFSKDNGQWVYETKLFTNDGTGGGLGRAIGASGNSVVCGAKWASVNGQFFAGKAYCFHFDGAEWKFHSSFSPNDVAMTDYFGGEVAVDGTTLVVGSTGQDAVATNAGATYVYTLECATSCPADTNNDGQLTPTDFTAWINAYNNNLPECDQNGDGACTPTDFTAWIAGYNAGC